MDIRIIISRRPLKSLYQQNQTPFNDLFINITKKKKNKQKFKLLITITNPMCQKKKRLKNITYHRLICAFTVKGKLDDDDLMMQI